MTPNALRVLLPGPNRWPKATTDPHAGLKIRRAIVVENGDLDVDWLLMEDETSSEDPVRKFLALTARATHVFLFWPREAKMVGTEDELILWQAMAELGGQAPECYLFHQTGVLRIERRGGHERVVLEDDQGKSPYIYDILRRGVFEQVWTDHEDLKRQVREVLVADLGAPPRGSAG